MFRPSKTIAGTTALIFGLGLFIGGGSMTLADDTPAAPPAATMTPRVPSPGGKSAPQPNAAAQPAPAPKSAPYPDVPVKHPAAAAVASVKNKKIMGAKPDGNFHGPDYVTRFELAVILDRFVAYNENEHKPIRQTRVPGPYKLSAPAGHWAYDAQLHLAENAFLPATSPLFKDPGTAKITTDELSEALAQVEVRLSDRSLPQTTHDDPVAPTVPRTPPSRRSAPAN